MEILCWVTISGMAIGVLFDFYRSLRRQTRIGPVLTIIGDLVFSGVALTVLFHLFSKANFLEFRFYLFWGSLFGLLIYLRFFSRFLRWWFSYLFGLLAKTAGVTVLGLEAVGALIAILMRPPYFILRWLSMLFYRIGESLGPPVFRGIRMRINKAWKRVFPPRHND